MRMRLHHSADNGGSPTRNEDLKSGGGATVALPAANKPGSADDLVVGLQNNLCRHYDPTPGSWLSEDPIGFEGGDENLRKYVGE